MIIKTLKNQKIFTQLKYSLIVAPLFKRTVMDQAYVSTVLKAYKDSALVPTPVSAILKSYSDNVMSIYSTWRMPDVIKAESTKFTREFLVELKSDSYKCLSSSTPTDISTVSQQVFTKSRSKYAVFRKSKKSDDAVYLEVWNSNKKESTFDLSEFKEHGKVQDNGTFSSLEWSADEKHLLYIADAPTKKNESFFKDFFCSSKCENKSETQSPDEVTKGEEFLYKESWGECNTNAHHTVLCIFNTLSGKVEVLNMEETFPNVSVAEATWGPNDENIIFSGFFEEPYRLGIVYCQNRRSAIFSFNLNTKIVERLTSEDGICVTSPVFSPNFETILFLQSKANGPHRSSSQIMRCSWKTKEIRTVLPVVDESIDDFWGVYSDGLKSWWSSDSRFFFFNSHSRSIDEMYYVDVESSEMKKIPYSESCSKFILDVKEPYILAAASNVTKAPHLVIGQFSFQNGFEVRWNVVEPPVEFPDLCWNVYPVKPSLINKQFPSLDFEIILIHSKEKKTDKLILWIHGGPHSVFGINYCPASVALAKLGYIICKVNYRGSVGFGQNSIRSLLGNIGSQDVSDAVSAVKFVKQLKEFDIKEVFGLGGSHGGFLVAHLLGQYPELLKAAVIRNPVIDLTSFSSSDIPDWGMVESGVWDTFDPSKTVDSSQVQELWEKSPLRHVNNVKAPTLLHLGKLDLRAPSSHGINFYRHLKAKGMTVKVYFYEDNHALSKVGVSSEGFVTLASWFKTHSDL